MKKRIILLAIVFLIATITGFANATQYGGVEFPDGEASFADAVVSFISNPCVNPVYDDPYETLGIPDFAGPYNGFLTMGPEGELVLEFTDNALTTSGNDSIDLWVFEIGTNHEPVDVYISTDKEEWIFAGSTTGATSGVDIDNASGVLNGTEYHYVKLVDLSTYEECTSEWAGADIDAVGAISSAPTFDADNDGIYDYADNCPTTPNPLQEDSYPPGGNGCGDACECEGNFDGNQNQNASDYILFRQDHGRIDCTNQNPCNGDFDCDGDVDGEDEFPYSGDAAKFVEDFGRGAYFNPCPTNCVTVPWCVYDQDSDGVPDGIDNCQETPNGSNGGTCTLGDYNKLARPCMDNSQCGTDGFCSMNQEETDGDGIGDACDLCEGNFDCDADCDGLDLTTFLGHFGRGQYFEPCTNSQQCKGDFLCDGDVDGEDVTKALECFGRGQYSNPCPECPGGDWCEYP